MAKNMREEMRKSLLNKTQHSYEHREDSGQFKSIFMDDPSLKFWKCKSGEHIVDVIPYKAGPNDPDTKEGEYTYVLILWVHYGIGVNQDAYVCPARNYGLPCPICEYREELRKQEDYDEDLVKSLNPKRRSIYNVVVYDSEKEMAKGVQIFDVAHWFMERTLVSMAKTPTRPGERITDPWIPFSDPDSGKSISFERKGEGKQSDFIGHKFVDRNYSLPDEYLTSAYTIDQWVIRASYEELKDAFFGVSGEEMAPPEEEKVSAPPIKTPKVVTTPTPKAEAPTEVGDDNPCPAGGVYGEDCEKLENCNGCEAWEECSQLADQIAAENQATPPPPPPAVVARPPIPVKTTTTTAKPTTPAPAPAKSTRPAPAPIRRPIPIKR